MTPRVATVMHQCIHHRLQIFFSWTVFTTLLKSMLLENMEMQGDLVLDCCEKVDCRDGHVAEEEDEESIHHGVHGHNLLEG